MLGKITRPQHVYKVLTHISLDVYKVSTQISEEIYKVSERLEHIRHLFFHRFHKLFHKAVENTFIFKKGFFNVLIYFLTLFLPKSIKKEGLHPLSMLSSINP
jgi:aspartate/tyrosine/aromatic aminotransferase